MGIFFLPNDKNHASSRLLAKIRVSQVFRKPIKNVYLQGPHSSRPCILRPCCIYIWKKIQTGDIWNKDFMCSWNTKQYMYSICIGSNSRLNNFSNACKILVFQLDMETFDLNEPISPFFNREAVLKVFSSPLWGHYEKNLFDATSQAQPGPARPSQTCSRLLQ